LLGLCRAKVRKVWLALLLISVSGGLTALTHSFHFLHREGVADVPKTLLGRISTWFEAERDRCGYTWSCEEFTLLE
jgi:hypothetical protein